MKKRIFILSSEKIHLENTFNFFLIEALSKSKKLEDLFQINATNKLVGNLPWDYDVYFLHISDIEIEQIIRLREIRPKDWIYGFTNPGVNTHRVYDLVDKAFDGGIDYTEFTYVLQKMKNYRKK